MADRVPWPRKTGGTWGQRHCPPVHSPFSCTPVCSNGMSAKHTGESCHHETLWMRHLTDVTSAFARPEDLTESPSAAVAARPDALHRVPTTLRLRHATDRLPLRHVATPNARGSRRHCVRRALRAFRFNDAFAIWQLMGCVTAASEPPPFGRPSTHRARWTDPVGARCSARDVRDAPATEPVRVSRAAPRAAVRRATRSRCTVIYFSGSPVSPFPATDA